MKKKLLAGIMAAVLLVTGCSSNGGTNGTTDNTTASTSSDEKPTEQTMRDITTMDLVKDMGIGINLGNTFESCGTWINGETVTNYETAWGSPVVTEDMIKGYKTAGFGVLRIPVAWSNMMAEDYTIDATYMARVKEVVDWALDCGLYVVLNIHYDSGWWENFPTDKEKCMAKYESIWKQICENFKDYGDYLMFESLNEEGGWESMWNRWSGSTDGKAESFGLLNEINQKFVDIVRSSGGNNGKRHLLIAGYNTDFDLTCDDLFVMPTDSEKRCAVSVHYYTPSTFCILEKDASWGKARKTWGTEKDKAELEKYMTMVKEKFVDNGVPVIIGEYGVSTKNKTEETVRNFISIVCESAYKHGLCPVLWDITGVFYDRYSCTMKDQLMMDNMTGVLKGNDITIYDDPAYSTTAATESDTPVDTTAA